MKPVLRNDLRLLFALIAIVFTAWSLSIYAHYLQRFISVQYSFWFELAMVLGQLLFQTLFILKRPWRLKLHYYLQLLTVSFMGSVLLWGVIGWQAFLPLNDNVALGYFFCVLVFMFFEHKRRLKRMGLPVYLSFTWLLYRGLILLYLL